MCKEIVSKKKRHILKTQITNKYCYKYIFRQERNSYNSRTVLTHFNIITWLYKQDYNKQKKAIYLMNK